MKKILIGLLAITSFSSFALEGVTDKLNEKGILCNYEEYVSERAYEALKKDPQNQELKNELSRTQKLSVRCWSKAERAADSATSCEEAIDKITDAGSLCTAEDVASDMAYFLVMNNSTQANKDLLSGTQQANVRCIAKAYDICK
jgi:hypothetical protein